MQLCYACKKEIADGSIVAFKGLGIFKQYNEIHGVNIIEEKEITHEHCSED